MNQETKLATLAIQPGCEAGSDFCNGCEHEVTRPMGPFKVPYCREFKIDLEIVYGFGQKRCQACIDAEIKPEQAHKMLNDHPGFVDASAKTVKKINAMTDDELFWPRPPPSTDFAVIEPYVKEGAICETYVEALGVWLDFEIVGILSSECKRRIPQAEIKKDGGASWATKWFDWEKWEADHDS